MFGGRGGVCRLAWLRSFSYWSSIQNVSFIWKAGCKKHVGTLEYGSSPSSQFVNRFVIWRFHEHGWNRDEWFASAWGVYNNFKRLTWEMSAERVRLDMHQRWNEGQVEPRPKLALLISHSLPGLSPLHPRWTFLLILTSFSIPLIHHISLVRSLTPLSAWMCIKFNTSVSLGLVMISSSWLSHTVPDWNQTLNALPGPWLSK